VIDIGREVPVETILKRGELKVTSLRERAPDLHLKEQKKLKRCFERWDRDKYLTMVGGAPCTLRWANGSVRISIQKTQLSCQKSISIFKKRAVRLPWLKNYNHTIRPGGTERREEIRTDLETPRKKSI
jgi:hypothetical protein